MVEPTWNRCESTEVDGFEALIQQLEFFSSLNWTPPDPWRPTVLAELSSTEIFTEAEISKGWPNYLLNYLALEVGVDKLKAGRATTEEVIDWYRRFIFKLRSDPSGGGGVTFRLEGKLAQAVLPLPVLSSLGHRSL